MNLSEEGREARRQAMLANWRDPERRAKWIAAHRAANKAMWADPERRAAMAAHRKKHKQHRRKELPDMTPQQRNLYYKLKRDLGLGRVAALEQVFAGQPIPWPPGSRLAR